MNICLSASVVTRECLVLCMRGSRKIRYIGGVIVSRCDNYKGTAAALSELSELKHNYNHHEDLSTSYIQLCNCCRLGSAICISGTARHAITVLIPPARNLN
jgi:hypothetical protein